MTAYDIHRLLTAIETAESKVQVLAEELRRERSLADLTEGRLLLERDHLRALLREVVTHIEAQASPDPADLALAARLRTTLEAS